tara:strand:+ start:517 stop:840 length:324 start_codon:yes stop_codon:yes gene_type:complete
MPLRMKHGVSMNGIKPEMVMGINLALGYFDSMGIRDMVVTSIVDGKHSYGSLHYVGYAADIRIWAIESDGLAEFTEGLAEELGEEFDVTLEKDHIHIEFQPKTTRGA